MNLSRSRMVIVLLVLLAAAITYAWVASPRQERVGERVYRPLSAHPAQQTAAVDMPEIVNLQDFIGTSEPFRPPHNNLFGALFVAPPPPKPVAAPPPSSVRPPPIHERAATEPTMPYRQQPPDFEVLGFLQKSGGPTVFLASPQGDIYLVKDGSDFADNWRVRQIDQDKIVIVQKGTAEQVVLRLEKAESQRLPTVRIQSDRPSFVAPDPQGSDQPEAVPSTEAESSTMNQ